MGWSCRLRTGTRPRSRQKRAFLGYLRVPQGYLSSVDSYTKHTDPIIDECPGKPAENNFEKTIDDIIQWSDNMEDAFFRICSILSHCNQNGMVFSPEKFQFASKSVELAGFQITMKGNRQTSTSPHQELPNNSTVRSWFSLINQVVYSFMKTDHMAPFRHLLSQSTSFGWKEDLETASRGARRRLWS